jgi:hypothetical protein
MLFVQGKESKDVNWVLAESYFNPMIEAMFQRGALRPIGHITFGAVRFSKAYEPRIKKILRMRTMQVVRRLWVVASADNPPVLRYGQLVLDPVHATGIFRPLRD